MGIIRRLREWREEVDGTLTGPAVETESITDGTDGNPWETLREAGYNTNGIVPLVSFGSGQSRYIGTAEDTFGNADGFNQLQVFLNWDIMFPPDGTTYVYTGIQFDFSNKGYYQLYNNTDGEVVGSTIEGTGNQASGWVQYEPTTTNGVVEIFPRLRSDTQGTTTSAQSPTFLIGVEI